MGGLEPGAGGKELSVDEKSNIRTPRPLIAAMILQYAVGGSIIPFISLLLMDRGLSVAQVSLVLLASSMALLISPFFWGMMADRYVPLNRLFILMNLIGGLALAAFIPQQTFQGVLVTFTVFFACYQPTPILVNALSFRHLNNPVKEFAPLRAYGSWGWMLPSLPIFLWMMLHPQANFEGVLYLTIGLSAAMMGLSFWLPHTPPGAAPGGQNRVPQLGYWEAMKRLLHNPSYLVVLGSYFLISASFCIQAFYSPPRLIGLGFDRAWIGLVQSLGVVIEIILFALQARIVNRLGYPKTIVIGCLMLTLRQVIFASSDNLWILSASYALVGVTVVFFHIGINILVEAIAGPEVKSTAQIILVLCSSGLGPIFANGVVGWLAPGAQPKLTIVFLFGAILGGLASTMLFLQSSHLQAKSRGT